MKLLAIALILVILAPFAVVMAQDAPPCDPASLIAEMAALKSTGDAAKDVAALMELRDAITAQNVACNGYTFEGSGGKAVGPIELPEGKYLLTFTTNDYIILNGEIISGQCSIDGSEIGDYILNESEGGASQGAAVIIDSDGCKVLFITRNNTSKWTMIIEPLQ